MERKEEKTVVSTFSGVGGSSKGYELTKRCKVLAACEFIDIAADNYQANFRSTPIIRKDIREVSGDELLKLARIKKGELDILDGSPPCSSYSSSGRREKGWNQEKYYSEGVSQRTDNLFDEQIRLIGEMNPKAIVIENVVGMTRGVARPILMQYCQQIKNLGYEINIEILSAQFFNCATERHRMFIIGFRKDLDIVPSHPKPQTKAVTIRQALVNIKNSKAELKFVRDMLAGNSKRKKLARNLKQGQDGGSVHKNGSYFNLKRQRFDKPMKALTTHAYDLIHPTEDRLFTIRELKACSSFPPDFMISGTYEQCVERIGRAVPPNLMKAIANHVCDLLDQQ